MYDPFHVPLWLWGVAIAVVLAVAAADVLHASRSRGREPGLREAALWTAGVVALGGLFGLALAAVAGPRASGQFYAGWLTEYSLSLDNLFVFVLLIGRSGIAGRLRSRVLLAGIGLALLLRAVFIAAGAAALNRFDWVLYIFGAGHVSYNLYKVATIAGFEDRDDIKLKTLARIVGKHCESGDIIVRDTWVPDDVTPGDLAATIYHHMGVPLDATYTDGTGRPRFIVENGKPIGELV